MDSDFYEWTKGYELKAPLRAGNYKGHSTYVMLRFWWIPWAGPFTGTVRGDPPVRQGMFMLMERT